jgi:hypothetical protein
MSNPIDVTIRGSGSDVLRIVVQGRSHPRSTDYWDGNWITVEIEVHAGRFRGRYPACLRTTDFLGLKDNLAEAHRSLKASIEFEPMEEQLAMRISGDGRGHFTAECRAQDEAGIGNVLEFELHFDQTEIPPVLRSLDAVLAAFPVLGVGEGCLTYQG